MSAKDLRPYGAPFFHCDLGQLAYGSLPKGDFRPFACAEEMTAWTGLPAEEWLRRKAEGAKTPLKRTKATKKVETFFDYE